ncbi:MAG: hypothetical protein QOJ23_3137 [Actinomycetota bacterium]|nr:hypothetical protein [Actinomycetota bacterium]
MRRRVTGLAATIAFVGSLLAVAGVDAAPSAQAGTAPDQVVFVAGDIARAAPNDAGTQATGALLRQQMAQNPGARVLMLGDGAYASGTLSQYQTEYQTTGWGDPATLAATFPVPGNHDYGQNEAKGPCTPGTAGCDTSGFRTFFGSSLDPLVTASSPDGNTEATGWWSTTLGAWHLVGLNWSCEKDSTGCGANGRQGTWLANDLAKNPAPCTLALWHGAPFFSANGSDAEAARGPSVDPKTDAYWKQLQGVGADVVLAGHQHQYERFDHMSAVDPSGAAKGTGQVDAAGMREFVVGTGGGDPGVFEPSGTAAGTSPPAGGWPLAGVQAVGSQFALAGNFGVLKMVLHDGSYDWQFISAGAGNSNPDTVGEITTARETSSAPAGSVTPTTVAATGTVLDSGSDTCHHAGSSTTGPTTPATSATPTTAPATTPPTSSTGNGSGPGYWMAGSDGNVYSFGAARNFGNAAATAGAQTVNLAATPSGNGYWVLDSGGNVSAFGDATLHGQPRPAVLSPGETVTSLSPTPTGAGYWIFTSRGRAMPFGDAAFYGDMSGTHLNGPVLGSIPTPAGHGYYMVASDGGIFAFGDAQFKGSMGGQRLNAPVQSLVPTRDGRGYWLVASDGGIFAFGAAPFQGSMGGHHLNRPVVGMVPFADGYLMVGADGGIFDFSAANFLGSLGASPPAHPVVSVAARG